MTQCSVLFVTATRERTTHASELRPLGFVVKEVEDLPPAAEMLLHHVVVLSIPSSCRLAEIATRLRAVPHFGRRVLVALVPESAPETARRDGVVCGFDEVLPRSANGRTLAAAILKGLHHIPELRCILRPLTKRRRKAA